ncbi:UNVERIFIED_CONTAM: hypothetical protein Sangu_0277100 [Sesamum angustifolium]|uniref:Uncharacterized protein n=1 Tax=Sesamum angustifolium TaxID=2727405 RepID=A0AAW2QNT3_9LAMI
MQPGNNPLTLPFPLSPLLLLNAAGGGVGDLGEGGFELSKYLFLGSLLFYREGGGMDLSKVGEKILSSVRSARSLGLLPSTSDRPEVPARAAAAAAVARVLAALPSDQRHNLSSSSEELISIYGSRSQGPAVDELEKEFYEEGGGGQSKICCTVSTVWMKSDPGPQISDRLIGEVEILGDFHRRNVSC